MCAGALRLMSILHSVRVGLTEGSTAIPGGDIDFVFPVIDSSV